MKVLRLISNEVLLVRSKNAVRRGGGKSIVQIEILNAYKHRYLIP